MSLSISYYIILLVLKLKGIKKVFSKDPIDYLKLRKADVFIPKNRYLKKNIRRIFSISDTEVTEIAKINTSQKLLIYIHGGAFVSGPAQHHWDVLVEISQKTDFVIWVCNYPKGPEHKISEINHNMDKVYLTALEQFKAENIILVGDSVGGTLILTLTQRLIQFQHTCPKKIILISPVVDASLQNPDISAIDHLDPMLSVIGVRSAKQMAAGPLSLNNSEISPINGSFKRFPESIIFAAEHDITYPDQLRLAQILKEEKINHQLIIGKKMPHIWPLLPIMRESQIALNAIIKILNE